MKRLLLARKFIVVLLSLVLLGGCRNNPDGQSGDGSITIVGKVYYPPQVGANTQLLVSKNFQVVDLEKAPAQQIVAEGTTDSDGNYSVTVTQSRAMAVIAVGLVRVSGLISADASQFDGSTLIAKDFNGPTDIACEAGVSAIQDGSVDPDDFDSARIANLELAASLIAGSVNYLDPSSVTAAAQQVRQLTDNGAHPPKM